MRSALCLGTGMELVAGRQIAVSVGSGIAVTYECDSLFPATAGQQSLCRPSRDATAEAFKEHGPARMHTHFDAFFSCVQADCFSFGVCLWEICTRDIPMRGYLRDVQAPAECPENIRALLSECMASNPEQRPSAEELVRT